MKCYKLFKIKLTCSLLKFRKGIIKSLHRYKKLFEYKIYCTKVVIVLKYIFKWHITLYKIKLTYVIESHNNNSKKLEY